MASVERINRIKRRSSIKLLKMKSSPVEGASRIIEVERIIMHFQNKDNLQIHKKKAHSGRGEKKKKA